MAWSEFDTFMNGVLSSLAATGLSSGGILAVRHVRGKRNEISGRWFSTVYADEAGTGVKRIDQLDVVVRGDTAKGIVTEANRTDKQSPNRVWQFRGCIKDGDFVATFVSSPGYPVSNGVWCLKRDGDPQNKAAYSGYYMRWDPTLHAMKTCKVVMSRYRG